MSKKCSKCKIVKDEHEFCKNSAAKDGLQCSCKDCYKLYQQIEKNKEAGRRRARKSYVKHAERIREKERLKRMTPENIEKRRIYYREHLKTYEKRPERKLRKSIRAKVLCQIELGKMIRPTECSKCGSNIKIQQHHKDYSKPLDVIWLCNICHGLEHRKDS